MVNQLYLAVICALMAGCAVPSEYRELQQLDAALKSGSYKDTTLWARVAEIRPRIIELNDHGCDTLYNDIVRNIVASDPFYDERFQHVGVGVLSAVETTDPEIRLQAAHSLRYCGNYNAARSVYGRLLLSDRSTVANIYGNLAMEYERIGLLRSALQHALKADSTFSEGSWNKGRLWTQRILYNIHSKLGFRERARNCLRTFRQLMLTVPEDHLIQTDTVTLINLVHSIHQFSNVDSDLDLAFGPDAQRYRSMYQRLSRTQPIIWRYSWLGEGAVVASRPKPIIREISSGSLIRIFTDSVVPTESGDMAIETRFGTYVEHGDRWKLTTSRYSGHSHSLQPATLPRLDTLLAVMAPIRAVFPIGSDTLLVVQDDSLVVLAGSSVRRLSRSQYMRGKEQVLDVRRLDRNNLLVVHQRSISIYSIDDFLPVSVIDVDTLRVSTVFTPGWTTPIMPLRRNVFLVQIGFGTNVIGVVYDPSAILLRPVNLRVRNRDADIWGEWRRILMVYSEFNHEDFMRSDTVILLQYDDRTRLHWHSRLSDVTRIHSADSSIASRTGDVIDIVDTAKGRVYPQFALPIPKEANSSNAMGVFNDSEGAYAGYYHDGYVLTRFKLSNQWYPFKTNVMIRDHGNPWNVRAIQDVRSLQAGHTYSIFSTSNALSIQYPPNCEVIKRSGLRVRLPAVSSVWNRTFTASDDDDSLVIIPGRNEEPLRLAVITPLTAREWFTPTLLSSGLIVVAIGLIGMVRYRRRRRQQDIERVKSQQLESLREDMHDMIGSRLVRIASLTRQASPENTEMVLSRIHDMTLVTVRSLRNLLSLMSETSMRDADFYGAVREYVSESCRDAGLTCTIEITLSDEHAMSMDGSDRHELMMIVSEMLANTLRHAHARHINFSVNSTDRETTICWKDDGAGIAPESKRGNGLNNIKRRASRLSATVDLDSSPGNGTSYTIVCPNRKAARS